MEEKKLTDEEIVQRLEYGYNEKTITQNALDLIHRLQDENERLTEENGQLKGYNSGLEYENAELQKQVDELLNRRIEPKIFQCHADTLENCPKVEQAVKDRAKEIWGDCIDKIMRGCGDDKEFWVMEILIETFKKYEVGFEVE